MILGIEEMTGEKLNLIALKDLNKEKQDDSNGYKILPSGKPAMDSLGFQRHCCKKRMR